MAKIVFYPQFPNFSFDLSGIGFLKKNALFR